MTIRYAGLRKKWKQDPEFQKEFEAVRPEFRLARQLIEARTRAGLSQDDLAEHMDTSQQTVTCLEGRSRRRS